MEGHDHTRMRSLRAQSTLSLNAFPLLFTFYYFLGTRPTSATYARANPWTQTQLILVPKQEPACCVRLFDYLLGLLFDPENRGSTFLRNVGYVTSPKTVSACCLFLTGCLNGLLFDCEDGGSTFLRNIIKFLPDYTASHPRT
jgi:hypothetical protein